MKKILKFIITLKTQVKMIVEIQVLKKVQLKMTLINLISIAKQSSRRNQMSPKAKFLQKRINQIKEMNLRVIVMRMKILKKKNQKNVKRHQKTINLKKILFEMKIQTSKIIKN